MLWWAFLQVYALCFYTYVLYFFTTVCYYDGVSYKVQEGD